MGKEWSGSDGCPGSYVLTGVTLGYPVLCVGYSIKIPYVVFEFLPPFLLPPITKMAYTMARPLL